MRRLALPVLATAFAVAAPPAQALPSDRSLPVKTAADGVHLTRGPGNQWILRFGKRADRLYRREIAGRRVQVTCGDLTPQPLGGGLYSGGLSSSEFRAPKRRKAFSEGSGEAGTDLCAVSTRERRDGVCLNAEAREGRWCLRVVVAGTPRGRTRIDEFGRYVDVGTVFFGAFSLGADGPASLAELQGVLGDDVVELPARDAVPRRGVVGYWTDGEAVLVAAVTRAGIRRFIALDGDVYSTNLPDEVGPADDVGLFG